MAENAIAGYLALAVIGPLACASITALTQSRIVQDRRRRTGQGWDAVDTFEVKDAFWSTATFVLPIALVMAFCDAKLDWPTWQWWSALFAISAAGSIPMQLYGRWTITTRKHLEATTGQKISEPTS